MRTYLVPALLLVFLSSGGALAYLVVGCAAPRSNTRTLRETVSLTFRNAKTTVVKDHALLALPALVQVAQEYGAALAKYFIQQQAGQYEATATATTSLKLEALEVGGFGGLPKLNSGGYFIFLRTVQDAAPAQSGLPRFDAAARIAHAQTIAEALKNHCEDVTAADLISILEQGRITGANPQEELGALAFCGVGLVRQRETARTLELQLIGYIYPALKAKNAAFKVPFTRWHATESKFHLRLEGPLAAAQAFQVGADFDVNWDRDQALAGQPAEWHFSDQAHGHVLSRSRPVTVPAVQDFSLRGTLTESCNLKKMLEQASELAAKLKAEPH